jgi:peptidoglycan/xylan/chitin deacetylase (PgdA/CDA1 family)
VDAAILSEVVSRGARESNSVALTFDDGPGRSTDEILALLDRHEARATFFMVGSQAEHFPDIARKVAAAGHEIGSHTFSHLDHHAVSPEQAVADMVRGAEAVAEAIGFEPRLYRAPYGHFVRETIAEARRRGWACVFWTALGFDWEEEATPRFVADHVLPDLKPGTIVLLHDARRAKPMDPEPVTGATAILLDEIERRGLRAVAVGDIL